MTIQIKKINFKHSFIFFLFCNIISLPFIKTYNLNISPLVCLVFALFKNKKDISKIKIIIGIKILV